MKQDEADAFWFYWRVHAHDTVPDPVREYNFDRCLNRNHLFDFAWLASKVAVEVNGNAWGAKGGGRHGKDADLEKLNIAISLGWRVFQFSPKMLRDDPVKCVDMVVEVVQKCSQVIS